MSNYSSDLFWEIIRTRSSYIVKRGHGTSKVVFSKEPLNLTNKHTRKQSGLVNEKAVGVQPAPERGVVLVTKNSNHANHPNKLYNETVLKKHNRKVYATAATVVAKNGYRPDLRADAVARASNILASQRAKNPTPTPKRRSMKARSKAQQAA